MKELVGVTTIVMSLAIVASCAKAPAPEKTSAQDPVARGKYLVAVTACGDCHTPTKRGEKGPEPDLTRLLSGHPASMEMPDHEPVEGPWNWAGAATNTAYLGPWGTSYAANITSDPHTGIGAWTDATFIEAMRTGRHWLKDRPIMPPMPWAAYAQMTDDDLKAIFAYLMTVPPVENRVPVYRIPKASTASTH
ncbi:MAG TPA: c-type cytochrome [Candidatus Polarisedimenticolaceae bacterium]|nr:c-type cytochrome [Candidatus Polarisedimenticolaceae bacterium]